MSRSEEARWVRRVLEFGLTIATLSTAVLVTWTNLTTRPAWITTTIASGLVCGSLAVIFMWLRETETWHDVDEVASGLSIVLVSGYLLWWVTATGGPIVASASSSDSVHESLRIVIASFAVGIAVVLAYAPESSAALLVGVLTSWSILIVPQPVNVVSESTLLITIRLITVYSSVYTCCSATEMRRAPSQCLGDTSAHELVETVRHRCAMALRSLVLVAWMLVVPPKVLLAAVPLLLVERRDRWAQCIWEPPPTTRSKSGPPSRVRSRLV